MTMKLEKILCTEYYESPGVEILHINTQGFLCQSKDEVDSFELESFIRTDGLW